ncbi:hypothetical protein FZEAL_1271 [Fusarium zealandicum]|uniref:C3H1-type domain-containing protein n=1 Tax=Fusarium zealandicum TaxID=1053134 RepID=A0A8H4XNY6_9HYPO|nr:hypothetical protein FZEAL_1271 [Fusarium zealandicum]
MSGYGYGPPPPPPASSGGPPSYGPPAPSYQHSQGRGGAHHGRGRGGHYNGGRGDYHGSPQGHYEYSGQPYPPHPNPPSYGASHPPAGAYPAPQPQWGPEHGHPPPHGHPPAPMPPNNYHPNYPPQPYPPTQYPQQPPYGGPQAYPYQGPPAPPGQTQWNGQGQSPQGHYGNGRPRGGYNDRGGPKPPMNGPMRPGYEHEPMAPPVNAYGQPYPHDPRAAHYPPAQYPAYPGPPPPPGPPHQDGYYGHNNRRGRGGYRDGNSRGRGAHHGNDKPRHHKPGQNEPSHSKPETPTLGKKKKRKINTLGLTPGMDSESEDDEGEEKVLTDLIGQETLNVKDVAAFLADRKKQFPTKARVEAKKAAELAHNGEDKASSLEKQADKLRRQLRKVESSIKRKREQGDEGDEMRDPSEESSDDEPEVMSTRSHVAPPPPPPAKKADVSRHCKYYSTGGTCGKKGKCRFVHDPEVREAAIKEREANNGRLTIQQRLILNDKEQEDLTVLQSIQYLREKGAMKPEDPNEVKEEIKLEKADPPAQPPPSSLLPAASASLPPLPIKREPALPRRNPPPSLIPSANSNSTQGIKPYQGWLLRPYGSTSGKSSKSDDLP